MNELSEEKVRSARDEEEVKWKLHIFQSQGIQTIIREYWNLCSRDGGVHVDSYVDLNLALQKALVPNFDIQPMLNSAMQDWKEDSPDGKPLTLEDFALFLFELTALWCNRSITLQAYLLFLSTNYVWITHAKPTGGGGGATHTQQAMVVSPPKIKGIEKISFLPQPFFELLTIAPPQEDERWDKLDEEQRFGIWYLSNFGREQETLLLVQRQVFSITHDLRSIFLFQPRQSPDFLTLVKKASIDLAKIFPVDAGYLTDVAHVPKQGAKRRAGASQVPPRELKKLGTGRRMQGFVAPPDVLSSEDQISQRQPFRSESMWHQHESKDSALVSRRSYKRPSVVTDTSNATTVQKGGSSSGLKPYDKTLRTGKVNLSISGEFLRNRPERKLVPSPVLSPKSAQSGREMLRPHESDPAQAEHGPTRMASRGGQSETSEHIYVQYPEERALKKSQPSTPSQIFVSMQDPLAPRLEGGHEKTFTTIEETAGAAMLVASPPMKPEELSMTPWRTDGSSLMLSPPGSADMVDMNGGMFLGVTGVTVTVRSGRRARESSKEVASKSSSQLSLREPSIEVPFEPSIDEGERQARPTLMPTTPPPPIPVAKKKQNNRPQLQQLLPWFEKGGELPWRMPASVPGPSAEAVIPRVGKAFPPVEKHPLVEEEESLMEVEKKSARRQLAMTKNNLPKRDLILGNVLGVALEDDALPPEDAVLEERMYDLPTRVPQLYAKQIEPLAKLKAYDVYRSVKNGLYANEMNQPFEKTIEKLETSDRLGFVPGPLSNPSEPLWIEMSSNLEKVLTRAGRRKKRRRRRMLHSNPVCHQAIPRGSCETFSPNLWSQASGHIWNKQYLDAHNTKNTLMRTIYKKR